MATETEDRLVKVFEAVFPELPAAEIPGATQETVKGWESVAALELMNLIESTFAIVVDFDLAAGLNSFAKILAYVEGKLEPAR